MKCVNCGKEFISSEFAIAEDENSAICSDCYFGTTSEVNDGDMSE